jgi:succinate dehydrogenase / fumarate reductase flavoprotein subunit
VEGEVTYFIRQKDFQKLRNYPIKTFWPYILLPSRGRHKEGGRLIMKTLNSRIPEGPVAEKWTNYKAHQRLVNPKNKLKLDVIVVGTGLAGASAAASLGEMGFNVLNFCIQDSPRRAHSIAAQGGINAAKNYQNDGDSVYRLFYDTVKGGDYRAREANVYRLAEVSNNIIDQCVAQGVPFAREYGGMLANRSFGGAQVSRTFYAKGQTGQQLLLGAYSSLSRQVEAGKVKLYTRYEMEDVVIVDGKARGIIAKNLVTGKLERFSANAVVIATGGYGNAYFLSTNAMGCNCTAAIQAFRKGAMMANPSYVQIHPTCIPVHGNNQSKLTLMSESLRNDGRIWVPKNIEDAKALQAGTKQGWEIPEEDRDYYLERRYPAFGNLVPRDVASRAAKERCDKGFGVNNTGLAVFLDFSESIQRLGIDEIRQRYGNLFDMYEEITDVNPGELACVKDGVEYYKPMMIFPAIHYTMGGVWVDYELQTTIPGLFAIGECNFSDHGANRLGASALMQGLADGYFVLPYTIQNYLADQSIWPRLSTDLPEFDEAEKGVQSEIDRIMGIQGKRSVDSIHKELGHIMWEHVGMGRTKEGLEEGLKMLKKLRKEFDENVFVPGTKEGLNVELDKAIHLRDFILMGELVAYDALHREESCGGHFREEHQTEEGEAKRDDENFFYVGAWEYQGSDDVAPELTKEPLEYEIIKVQTRNYKN